MKAVIYFIFTIIACGPLYYVFDVVLRDYFLADTFIAGYVGSAPWYPVVMMGWKILMIFIVLIEIGAMWLETRRESAYR